MSEDYAAQVSIKFGPNMMGMLNLRAKSAPELRELISDAVDHLPGAIGILVTEVAKDEGLQAGAAAVAAQFPGTTVVNGQAAPAASNGQMCTHGARQYREDKAQPPQWKAWFCPQPQGAPDRCKPVYVK